MRRVNHSGRQNLPARAGNPLLWFAGLILLAGQVQAADDKTEDGIVPADSRFNETPASEIDTSRWRCRFCPDNAEQPWLVEIETGAGYVSNDSFKFGEYNGLYEKGLFPVLGVDAQYRDGEANYLDVGAIDLGLDNGRLELEGGRQGQYRVDLLLDQIERRELDTARTPYRGSTSQVLPSGWVTGSTTAGMTTLENDLEARDFSTRRRILRLDGRLIQDRHWSYDARFERQRKEGEIPFGAAIGSTFATAQSVILAKPVDYVTDRFELTANYRDNDLVGSLSYVVSIFDNDNRSLQWDNAFDPGANSETGQMALEPDSEMQQISASGRYRGFVDLALNGALSLVRLTQDDNFLPYSSGSTTPLPRSSLDGKVDIVRFDTSALWTPGPRWQAKLFLEYFEHVDDTDRATYTYVVADSPVNGTPRANVPYDFRTRKLGAEAGYRTAQDARISGGLEYAWYDRTYQEVDQSTETRAWAKYTSHALAGVNYSLGLEGASREADGYDVLAEISPPENPQLRKYNLADRDTVGVSLNLDFVAGERWFVMLSVDRASADYSNSSVGLTESEDTSAGLDLQFLLSEEISLTGYVNRAVIESTQEGSSTASDPDWSADNEDSVDTLGFGISYAPVDQNFRLGLEYTRSDATGEIRFADPGLTPLPDLESELENIEIYGEYDASENLTYRGSYAYEVYEEKNWNLDDVTPNTIDNVLTLGETSPDYRIGVFRASLKYRF